MRYYLLLILAVHTSILNAQIKVQEERHLALQLDHLVLVENHLAIHPADDQHLLLSGMYINPEDDEDYGVFASASFDGGKNWSEPYILEVPQGADPWGVITNKGVAIVSALSIDAELFFYRSIDGGLTWEKEVTQLGLDGFDHETMIYDSKNDKVFLISDRYNKIYYNASHDDGQTFPIPKEWQYNNLFLNTMTAQLSSDHTLLIPFSNYGRPIYDESKKKTTYSSLGKSYQFLVEMDEKGKLGLPRLICDNCEKGFPVLAVDHSNTTYHGNLYYVCSSQTNNEILFQYSINKGKSWTASKVIANYHKHPRTKRNPFTGIPQVTVNNKGVIGIIWQDRTDDPNGLCNRLYFTASLDGGKTFLTPKPISTKASCMETEQNSWGGKRYKSGGDYTGFVTNQRGEFIVIWPDSRQGKSQLYSASISVEQ